MTVECCLHVDCDHEAVLLLPGNVGGGLVDHVHQNGGQIGHHEDTEKFSTYGKVLSKINYNGIFQFKR